MTYPILRARVRALQEQLALVERSPEWLSAVAQRSNGEAMRDGLRRDLELAARNRREELEKICGQLEGIAALAPDAKGPAVRAAWRRYYRIQQQAEAIFGECLRFLGGLAIRSKDFDGIVDTELWEIADELVRSCASETTGSQWTSLTVPAPREAVAKTLARMIRVRFPAWNVWTMPLAAREYGHIVAEEAEGLPAHITAKVRPVVEPRLAEIVKAEVGKGPGKAKLKKELLATATGALDGIEPADHDDVHLRVYDRASAELERERSRFHVLVADAYATYTLGVAFACAALLLRFDPATGPKDAEITDAERGHVVLAMLERMNEESDGGAYTSVIETLRTAWTGVLTEATTSGLDPAHERSGKAFVDDIWVVFRSKLLSRYPDDDPTDGWLSVQQAKSRWQQWAPKTKEDFASAKPHLRKLRDALNAAWLWRLEHPNADDETIYALEQATVRICHDIINPTKDEDGGKPGSAQDPTIGGRDTQVGG